MIEKNQGAVTLLMTSGLLIISLLLTLSSYKTVFYQLKRSQNEIETRQHHWISEAGLACAFTKINNSKSMHHDLMHDCSALSLTALHLVESHDSTVYFLKGSKESQTITRAFKKSDIHHENELNNHLTFHWIAGSWHDF